MISIESGEHTNSGIADLQEAVELAKRQGISNAQNAVNPDLIWGMHSLGVLVGMGLSRQLPFIREGTHVEGVSVEAVDVESSPGLLRNILEATEHQVQAAAQTNLPGWEPTKSRFGTRMVTMQNKSVFRDHTDDYEGLVASVQMAADGQKIMRAEINGEWEETVTAPGDITLFAGDSFSDRSRTKHGFSFQGLFAVAFTLGQDPFYSISGRFPFVEENPHYFIPKQ